MFCNADSSRIRSFLLEPENHLVISVHLRWEFLYFALFGFIPIFIVPLENRHTAQKIDHCRHIENGCDERSMHGNVPDFAQKHGDDLNVDFNGEKNYRLCGMHVDRECTHSHREWCLLSELCRSIWSWCLVATPLCATNRALGVSGKSG